MVNALFAAIAVLAFSGCATAPSASTPEEAAFLKDVEAEATEFDIAKEMSDEVWSRAQLFVSKHASMKVQTASDYILETYNPTPDALNPSYGYRVTRAIVGGKARFSVECFNGNAYTTGSLAHLPARNARILSRFMRTGDLKYPGLVAR
jgi:hypothetical protein